MQISRRWVLNGLIAAPAIVAAPSLMKINSLLVPYMPFSLEKTNVYATPRYIRFIKLQYIKNPTTRPWPFA